MFEYFFILVAGHIFGDFLFQSDGMAARKREWKVLALHCSIHAIVAYLLIENGGLWFVPFIIFFTHFLIDALTCRLNSSLRSFNLDQALHVLSLIPVAFLCDSFSSGGESLGLFLWDGVMLSAGLVMTIKGAGVIVGRVSARIIAENGKKVKVDDTELTLAQILSKGLLNGGQQIGNLERTLIFMFVMLGQYTAIGFLVAAKTAFRFEESKKQIVGEYVLIGTLWSMGLAIMMSYATKSLLEW